MKFFNVTKGFGFVGRDDDSKDVIVHATVLEAGISGAQRRREDLLPA